jgi:predicted RND superfamily exporter protein
MASPPHKSTQYHKTTNLSTENQSTVFGTVPLVNEGQDKKTKELTDMLFAAFLLILALGIVLYRNGLIVR